MHKIEDMDGLKAYLLEAIDVCKYEINHLYECGAGKDHPDYISLWCAQWVYEKILGNIKPSCDKDTTTNNCDKDIT